MKKYLYSLGILYYSEKEALRIREQALKGWCFKKLNPAGFLVFEKQAPEDQQFTIDFYQGDNSPTEIQEYLDIYQASGWQCVSSYKNKYFFFKSDLGTQQPFSDKKSYLERLKAEERWAFKRVFPCMVLGLIGLVISLYLQFGQAGHFEQLNSFLWILASLLFLYPLLFLMTTAILHSRYKQRGDSYQNPEAFAKKQRVWLDTLLLLCLGAVIGGIIGGFMGYLM